MREYNPKVGSQDARLGPSLFSLLAPTRYHHGSIIHNKFRVAELYLQLLMLIPAHQRTSKSASITLFVQWFVISLTQYLIHMTLIPLLLQLSMDRMINWCPESY